MTRELTARDRIVLQHRYNGAEFYRLGPLHCPRKEGTEVVRWGVSCPSGFSSFPSMRAACEWIHQQQHRDWFDQNA